MKIKQVDRLITSNGCRSKVDKKTDPEIMQRKNSRIYSPHLRERIETIQEVKKGLDIENQAAMPILGGVGEAAIGGLIVYGGKKLIDWLIKKGADAELASKLGAATGSLGNHWNVDLFGVNECERYRAIQKLKTAYFKNPQEIVKKVEEGLMALYKLNFSDGVALNMNMGIVRGLFSALEALYQRGDTEEDIRTSCQWFINILEKQQNYPLIDPFSQGCMRRILVNNQKLLPYAHYKIPPFQGEGIARSNEYRKEIYETLHLTLVEPLDEILRQIEYDPLFLRKRPPDNLKSDVEKLRKALVKAFKDEVEYEKGGGGNYAVVKAMREVLTLADQIDPAEWSEDAKENKAKAEAYQRVFDNKFKGWAGKMSQIPEDQLQICFDILSKEYEASPIHQRKEDDKGKKFKEEDKPPLPKGFENWLDYDLNQLRLFFQKDKYSYKEKELNDHFTGIWRLLNLSFDHPAEKLTYKNYEKGLFFFRYIHALLDKKVSIGENLPTLFKDHLDEENKAAVLNVCRKIVHDSRSFPGTRNWEFFIDPDSETIPGLSLALHHKLTKHINDENGYVDLYGLKELVLKNAVNSLYPPNNTIPGIRSFLFSGPPGSGKSSFAEALANQLALPLFVLKPSMITPKRHGARISYDGTDMPSNSFFNMVNRSAPCILLIDEADEILPPLTKHKGDEEDDEMRSGTFISELEPRADKALSPKVISIMTTNFPLTETIDISSIDEHGYSGTAESELYNYIDSRAIREGRADKKIFIFHKLYNEQQGETLAKRFLSPYAESGKLSGPVDYAKAGKEIMGYAPGTIEKIFADTANATTEQITQEQMLNELKKHPSLVRLHADPQTVIDIEGIIKVLVKGSKTKKLEGPINSQRLAIQAKGLNYDQIFDTIMNYTPETLTQENILAAFERVRKEGS